MVLKADAISELWWVLGGIRGWMLFVEATSRADRDLRKLSPPSRPKTSSIVLALLMPLPC